MATANLQPLHAPTLVESGEMPEKLRPGWVILDRTMMHLSGEREGDERYRTNTARARAYRILFALRMLLNALAED